MDYSSELDFERDVIELLQKKGWSKEVLKYKTEKELLDNWANILYQNNKGIDKLNNHPLTEGEKAQLIEQIKKLKTPFNLNKLINGKTISIKRDNEDDKLHFGKEVNLKIYDRDEIAGGKSIYQIVEQPVFPSKRELGPNRRGDLMLLINGMPVIHIELKRSGVPVSQAIEQIKNYSSEGVFSGLFSLVQVFVAMTPNETKYFANPGEGKFNDKFFFHWADFNNVVYNDWNKIVENLLSIPMAHKLIGFYTVADAGDGLLKVLRSYQYYAVEAINNRVAKAQWTKQDQLGGYIWHTTGSGKTMTSFKAAQLVASSGKVDKAVFLVDRIELGTQSALEYRNFAAEDEAIQETESTNILIDKLKSNSVNDNLIVTSIQKMSNIKIDPAINKKDIERIGRKKIAFIIDECHRSTFGEMLASIKATFPTAIYFGFTGTPIEEKNQKKKNTTSDIFGDELHRYSIADGIKDGNVLGFDPYKVYTYQDIDLRKAVALDKSKSKDEDDAFSTEAKKKIYLKYINDVKMVGHYNNFGDYEPGIEDCIKDSQYKWRENAKDENQHPYNVVKNILENWKTCSVGSKFSALFAVSSIPEACLYYKLFKQMMGKNGLPTLKITGIFDETIENKESVRLSIPKEEAIIEILKDYNENYNQTYDYGSYQRFKKDVALRLAHKEKYCRIDEKPEEILNLVIVVDQLLTGFDSKWLNTLYLDKKLKYESIIQAFSRTNRIFGNDKPFGIVKYYRYPNTMERNINSAFKLYAGEHQLDVFVNKLEKNLNTINADFVKIKDLFESNHIVNFSKLPDTHEDKEQFALLFGNMCKYLEAAKIQGFLWEQSEYTFKNEETNITTSVKVLLNEETFLILALRYKELFTNSSTGPIDDVPFDINSIAIEIDTGKIDKNYMNNNFQKYIKLIQEYGSDNENVQKVLNDLHNSFPSLSKSDQVLAEQIINDVQSGTLFIDENKTLNDYIIEYRVNKKNNQIHIFATKIGIDETMLNNLLRLRPTAANLNEFGRFNALIDTLNIDVAKSYFDQKDNKNYLRPIIKMKATNLITDFIINGGSDI